MDARTLIFLDESPRSLAAVRLGPCGELVLLHEFFEPLEADSVPADVSVPYYSCGHSAP